MPTPQITITGHLQDIFGVGNTAASLRVQLVNFGGQCPRVTGTGLLAPTAPLPVAASGAGGAFSFQVYGNDVIVPGPNVTYYQIQVLDDKNDVIQVMAYQFTGTASLDLASVVPLITAPGTPVLANSLSIGVVSTLAPGASATASITGLAPAQILNLGIPAGATGATGPQGPAGTGFLILETNGISNGSQVILNLISGAGIVLTENGIGGVTIAASVTSVNFPWGGDGSDGAATFDGAATVLGLAPVANVYTLTRDIFTSALTVNSGVTIKTNNFAIFCSGTLTNNGTIQNDGITGGNGVASAGGSATLSAGATSARYPKFLASIAGTSGALGGTGVGAQAAAANTGNASGNGVAQTGAGGASGSAGGKGGDGVSVGGAARSGGAGGAYTPSFSPGRNVDAAQHGVRMLSSSAAFAAYSAANAGSGGSPGGGAGGGDGTQSGGAGGGGGAEGGSAGMLGIFAKAIINGASGVISTNGGTGGVGAAGTTALLGNTGGGGGGAGGPGGQGGILWLVYQSLTNSGTIQANGGVGGNGGAKGLPHGTGVDNATAGSNGPSGPAGVVIQLAA